MKSRTVVNPWAGTVLMLMFVLAFDASAQGGDGTLPGPEDESHAPPENVIPERYRPTTAGPTGPSQVVYFAPQDNTANVTVISLFSTSAVDENVRLETLRLDGSVLVDQTVLVPAGEMVRIVSDVVVSPPPADWNQAVFIQFFNTSAFARLTLPEGVLADAYIAWTNTLDYDPRIAVATFGVRFSTDPPAN